MPDLLNTEQNAQRCICGACPSYPGAGAFFCARGRAADEVGRRGCSCADCPNYLEFGLGQAYYCAEGAAALTT